MRKLATIRTISAITPIQDADRIVVAHIDGWECIINVKDELKVGDKVVYIEIDSRVPETPQFEFLRSRKFIVKTIKMRGQISQGLAMPLTVLPDGNYNVGDDVTDILGITKYDPELEEENRIASENGKTKKSKNPVIKYLMKFSWFRKFYFKYINKPTPKMDFPNWIVKTDEERIQNKVKLFEMLRDEKIPLTVTEKVDGCSATYFIKRVGRNKFDFGVCSRNRRLAEDNSHYWEIARSYNIETVLKEIIGENEDYIVLQGEITGGKIQGGKYGSKLSFWAFNLIRPNKKYDTMEMQDLLIKHGVYTVPITKLEYIVPETIADLIDYVSMKSQIVDRAREGCVFRNVERNISFKVINPHFLLENDV